MIRAMAFKVLGLAQDARELEVENVWRRMRSELHPDKPSGDAARFDQARKAYIIAIAYARRPKRCRSCDGTGKVSAATGWATLRTCAACKGTGRQETTRHKPL